MEEGTNDRRGSARSGGVHRRGTRNARAWRCAEPGGVTKGAFEANRLANMTRASFPSIRMRRGRSSAWMRAMVAEHRLHSSDLIWPLFVCAGRDREEPISSLPGVSRWSLDRIGQKAKE